MKNLLFCVVLIFAGCDFGIKESEEQSPAHKVSLVHDATIEHLDAEIQKTPNSILLLHRRAIAHLLQKNFLLSLADIDLAISLLSSKELAKNNNFVSTISLEIISRRIYFDRVVVRMLLGEEEKSRLDLVEALTQDQVRETHSIVGTAYSGQDLVLNDVNNLVSANMELVSRFPLNSTCGFYWNAEQRRVSFEVVGCEALRNTGNLA